MSSFEEVLSYLYSSLPMFHRIGPAALKPGLDNTLKFCDKLGNPQQKIRCIHVAGTNGKGSTSHMLASILQVAGYKTALYTSPHLKSFTERIKIDGKNIAEKEVVLFVNNYKSIIEEIKPSFFEVTVAMAFDYFHKNNVDIAVIETGLGGRLDSTNIINPVLSIITNISYDHQNILGNSLTEISSEKAGIIKHKVPVVVSETQYESKDIFVSKAKIEKSPIFFADERWKVVHTNLLDENLVIEVEDLIEKSRLKLQMGLVGDYQLKNVVGVLAAVEELKKIGFSITENAVSIGVQEVSVITGLKGRWQIINKHPLTICDTGHNEAGVEFIVQQLLKLRYDQLYWVIGMVNDKDCDKILAMLPDNGYYIFCQAKIPRALSANILSGRAANFNLRGEVVEDVNKAYIKAKELAGPNDLIMIGGSTFVVAEINDL